MQTSESKIAADAADSNLKLISHPSLAPIVARTNM